MTCRKQDLLLSILKAPCQLQVQVQTPSLAFKALRDLFFLLFHPYQTVVSYFNVFLVISAAAASV